MPIDWELVAKGAAGAAGIAGAVVQVGKLRGSFTASLKADLDLLEKLKGLNNKESYGILKASIDRRIAEKYGSTREKGRLGLPKVKRPGEFLFGIILLIGFSVWSAYLLRNGFRWVALIPAFFALAGLGSVMSGFEDRPPPVAVATGGEADRVGVQA